MGRDMVQAQPGLDWPSQELLRLAQAADIMLLFL